MAEDTSKTTPAKATPAKADPAPATDAPAAAPAADQPVVVMDAPSVPFATKPSDVPVDPRGGKPFEAVTEGMKGMHGFDVVDATGPVVQGVNPDRIPAEVTPGVSPDAGGDQLLAAAQTKAPNLTREFVDKFELSDEILAGIARGEISPPPAIGPIYTSDLYLTPGGWQQTPPGVPPSDVGNNAIGHR